MIDSYHVRIVDGELDALLPHLAAIALDGPKAVGKTTTARQRAKTSIDLTDPAVSALLLAAPERLDTAASPILLDEWQRAPQLWDIVRRSVDRNGAGGRFLLTGSAAPPDMPLHSGAGRIDHLRMRPLSLAERDLPDTPSVSLAALSKNPGLPLTGTATMTTADYVSEVCSSGFPAIRQLPALIRPRRLNSYIDSVIQRDFPEQGLLVRKPNTLRAWLQAYAAATATTASYNKILDAATAGLSDKPARNTVTAYREVLEQLWLLDPVAGWLPQTSRLSRLALAPKHHLADPALAVTLRGATQQALLTNSVSLPSDLSGRFTGTPWAGLLFESLVALSLRVYAQPNAMNVYHLRTEDGAHEIDFIVELPDSSVIAIETKLSPAVAADSVRHLTWLRDRIGDRLRNAIVVNTGTGAYRRPDGIGVIPASLLTA